MVCVLKSTKTFPPKSKNYWRGKNHDAHTVYDESLAGEPDSKIGKACRTEKRILVTLKQDFSDIRAYPPALYPGIVVLRYSKLGKYYVLNEFDKIIDIFQTENIEGKLWIVEENRIRIHD